MKPSQHSRPPAVCVCVWSVCGWMGHEEPLRCSTVHSAQVTRWVCLTLDWPGTRLSSLKAVSRQACFYLPPIFSSPCFPLAFFPGAQLWEDGSQAPGESRSAWPGRASHPTGPLTMINHIHTLSLVNRGPPHTHTYIHIQHYNSNLPLAHTHTHTHTHISLSC